MPALTMVSTGQVKTSAPQVPEINRLHITDMPSNSNTEIFRLRFLVPQNGRPHTSIFEQEIGVILQQACDCELVPIISRRTTTSTNDDDDDIDDETHSIHFKSAQAIQAPYEDVLFEVHCTVRCKREPDEPRQAPAFFLAEQWCRNSAYQLENQPWLLLEEANAFFPTLDTVHNNLNMENFGLGNLINPGVFLERYSFSPPRPELIKAEFEHDCRSFSIRFSRGMDPNEVTNHCAYRMEVNYSSIHHIVVDTGVTDVKRAQGVEGEMCMYMRLKYPPRVFRIRPSEKDTYKSMGKYDMLLSKSGNVERVSNFESCKRDTLGNSCHLRLGFSKHRLVIDEKPMVAYGIFFKLLSRLRTRAKVKVYFAAVNRQVPINVVSQYHAQIDANHLNGFSCNYALAVLMSRGFIVTDQINELFVRLLKFRSEQDPEGTEIALNRLTAAFDEMKHVALLQTFEKLYEVVAEELRLGKREEVPKNCVRVRKALLTPTRCVFLEPEFMMSNRVVREFGEEYAMRVVFRDDGYGKVFQKRNVRRDSDVVCRFRDIMLQGIQVAGRHFRFLAWSNSQLRDHGLYMYADVPRNGAVLKIADIHRWMGSFQINNVPKLMSRMGQCFTQSVEAFQIVAGSSEMKIEHDITGGVEQTNIETGAIDEPFNFSDGIGRCSLNFAKRICKEVGIEEIVPSAFQIRYAGFKGMLCVDPFMDEGDPNDPQVIFRDSMNKFEAEKSCTLEIVKWPQISPVILNRQWVAILDQVSKRQNRDTHLRISLQLHKMLEDSLFSMADMLLNERESRGVLRDKTPLAMDFNSMNTNGFTFTNEPFFRNILLAIHRQSIAGLLKCKLEIPLHLGRTVYGVLDEYGVLEYEQVFIQYSKDKTKPHQDIQRVEGTVMITKNPSVVPGDVRMFTAVWSPYLAHLVDVVVFPQVGPRPMPNEMAGSDLDGDEYAVVWMKELFLDRNEVAMSFPKLKPADLPDGVQLNNIVDFFIDYASSDNIGVIANAHLKAADYYGIFHPIPMSIAAKHSLAVDFPKTGRAPEALDDDERMFRIPIPDFMNTGFREVTYKSNRLVGQIYRKVKRISDMLELGQNMSVQLDPDLIVDGWERYKDEAIHVRNLYNHHIQSLLDQYGIGDEFQLVSGHIISIRNGQRVAENEKEDFSFYNTEKILELRIANIWDKFRAEFFRQFIIDESILHDREKLQRASEDYEDVSDVQQKASAWYMVTYDYKKHGNKLRLISFPWVVASVLSQVKRRAMYGSEEKILVNPVVELLDKRMFAWSRDLSTDHASSRAIREMRSESSVVAMYLDRYEGLSTLIHVLINWLYHENVFLPRKSGQSAFRPVHIAYIFLQFAIYQDKEVSVRLYTPQDLRAQLSSDTDPMLKIFSPAELLLRFIKYLSSEAFRNQAEIKFDPTIDDRCRFAHESLWHNLFYVAFKTYHHVALTSHFDSLYLTTARADTHAWDEDESEPMHVQLNQRFTSFDGLEKTLHLLKQWSGVTDIDGRRAPRSAVVNMYVFIACGSLESRQRLKEILHHDQLELSLIREQNPLIGFEL